MTFARIRMTCRRIRFEQWVLLFVVALGATSTSVIGIATLNQSHEGAIAKQALCSLKLDLEHRVDQGTAFLRANPNGAFGLTKAQIQASIDNQKRTIDSLSALHCKEGT